MPVLMGQGSDEKGQSRHKTLYFGKVKAAAMRSIAELSPALTFAALDVDFEG